jgi:hypothetical protein
VAGPTKAGTKVIAVAGTEGFSAGQTITIDNGANRETAVVASIIVVRRRFGGPATTAPIDSITVTVPLIKAHDVGVQVSGSGITLASPLTMAHNMSAQIASNVPTPGEPNQYIRKP